MVESRQWRRPAVVAIAAGLVTASGTATRTTSSAFPTKLVGQWTRKVTFADLKRSSGGVVVPVVPVGTACTLTIKATSAIHLVCTNLGAFDGRLVPAGPDRVYIKVDVPEKNVYWWRVSGRSLTFTKVSEPVPDRAAVFWGVWRRKQRSAPPPGSSCRAGRARLRPAASTS
jgi:hypothetical protein